MGKRMAKPKASNTSRASGAGKTAAKARKPASRIIDQRIGDLGDWREKNLAHMRVLILEADPEMIEERKWRKQSNAMAGVPVWSDQGIVCTGETYKNVVKLTFARGAMIPDPLGLFNSSLEGNTRRAIDIHEGEKVNVRAFKALVKAAVALNGPSAIKSKSPAKAVAKARPDTRGTKPTKLLSGGNPQIAKGDGDAPVQAYIAAMPGWKSDVGQSLDAIIVRNAPNVQKAVKWNSPFYGIEGQGWFLSFHVFTHYVKVTFFRGTSLRPVPPGGTERSKDARWIDISESDELDEAEMAIWVEQAAALPGWIP